MQIRYLRLVCRSNDVDYPMYLDAPVETTEESSPPSRRPFPQRLGVSQHSLYERMEEFASSSLKGGDEAEEIRH